MTDEHTAALKRARDSVWNALEILSSINRCWPGERSARFNLQSSWRSLSAAIDEESKS